eukprot:962805-Karenia_brevis.AAC.1
MKLLATAAGSSRARTLRMRVRACQKVCDWMYAVHGCAVPAHPVHLVDYLYDQLENKPLRTFPET